ncbi:heme peroxidase [Gloeopeniophorella convolvens]|nr:heme peroxidase [Gloeopeniophorella convolvens]
MSHIFRNETDSVLSSLQSAASYISSSTAPLDTDGAHPVPSLLSKSLEDIRDVVDHGPAFSLSDLPAYYNAVKNLGGNLDDRKFLLEKLLTFMARLGSDSEFGQRVQQFVISILYSDLPHPPSGYLALLPPAQSVTTNELSVNYAFRSADGSDYNPLIPGLGRAGAPYARSVPSTRCLSPAALPDANLVFDTLLKRDKFVDHPGGISSLFFAFADLIIHSCFNTNPRAPGWTQNDASSYLDLSPLYGSSDAEVASVRRADGTGRIWNDVFADKRLIYMPPSVCALLVLLSRNHNYIAEKILSINEWGKFQSPPPTDESARKSQDEEIFQRARLVNTGFFMQIILRDYVGAILGLVRDGSPWRLDPLMNLRDADHEVSPRGQGNVVSVEFNLLYRWHAALSEDDTKWTEELFADRLKGFDPKTGSVQDFVVAAAKGMNPGPDLKKWEFGGIKRGAEDRFADADIARILQNATAASASAFKARGTPEVLRVIELLSIEQSRAWGTCSLNEFRSFMGLKPYKDFKDWNPDPVIAKAAESLYHDIDNLELHVGMQAEQAKAPMPGAGLCPGYTISRAILSDAVALTRGDRFLTIDYTPFNLTTWGFDDCQADTADGSYGGILTKLLFRHLPDYYPPRSTYAHFPFLTPEAMKRAAKDLPGDLIPKYSWTRPAPPAGPAVVAARYTDVQKALASPAVLAPAAVPRLAALTGGVSLNLLGPVQQVLSSAAQADAAAKAFAGIVENLLKKKTLKGVGAHVAYIDVVRDVTNLAPVYWLSNEIIGLPLKTEENPRGAYREQELYGWFADTANYLYHNKEPTHDWHLRESSKFAADKALQYLRAHLIKITRGSVRLNVEGFTDSVLHWVSGRNDHSHDFLKPLVDATGAQAGPSALDGLAASLYAAVVPTAALFSQALTHVVNFYLDADRAAQRAEIARLAELRTPQADAQILPYVFEALRLDPPLSSVLLSAQADTSVAGDAVKKGQQVLASIIDANRDASAFQNPNEANFSRPTTGILGLDRKGLLTPGLFERVAPRILGPIFKLSNLRRQSTQSGQLTRFTETVRGAPQQFYVDLNGKLTPFPVSLIVQFDV